MMCPLLLSWCAMVSADLACSADVCWCAYGVPFMGPVLLW
jgi:hypothetical protein